MRASKALTLLVVVTCLALSASADTTFNFATFNSNNVGIGNNVSSFQHIGILSLEFHVDKLSRPLL